MLYPCKNGSPDYAGRWIINYLLSHTDIPNFFDEIYLFLEDPRYTIKSLNKLINRNNIDNLEIIDSITKLIKIMKKYTSKILYIPKSPFIALNKRFLINIIAKSFISKRVMTIGHLHGNFKRALINRIKSHNFNEIFQFLPSALLEEDLLKLYDIVLVHSYYQKELLSKYNLNVMAIPLGIDFNYLAKTISNKISMINGNSDAIDLHKERSIKIFYHGRLSWEKGVDNILYISYGLSNMLPDRQIIVYIAGSGSLEDQLKRLALKMYRSNLKIVFLGYLPHSTIINYLRQANIAIYPSLYESFGFAPIEALYFAKGIVVLSNKLGFLDWIPNYEKNNLFIINPNMIEKPSYLKKIVMNTISILSDEDDIKHKTHIQKMVAKFFDISKLSILYYRMFIMFGNNFEAI